MLQHTTFSHPTYCLLKFSPCSPWCRWMAFGLQRAKVLLIVRAISFQDFQPICAPDPPTSQTDGETGDMQSQYCASRGKNQITSQISPAIQLLCWQGKRWPVSGMLSSPEAVCQSSAAGRRRRPASDSASEAVAASHDVRTSSIQSHLSHSSNLAVSYAFSCLEYISNISISSSVL